MVLRTMNFNLELCVCGGGGGGRYLDIGRKARNCEAKPGNVR